MSRSIYYVLPDGNTYRSLCNFSVDPGVFLDLGELFRDGNAIGDAWDPPEVYLYEEAGEDAKPISQFPSLAGFFVIDRTALDILYPIIEPTVIEVLPLPSVIEGLSVLNIEKVDCIDHSKAQFEYFSSGRIMRVQRFAFIQEKLNGKHIFRLNEEGYSKVFVDDVFKTAVEENGLHGLLFFALDQI